MNLRNIPIYLDYNSSTPCDKRVIDAMQPYWRQFGNPHSNHYFGHQKQMLINRYLEILSGIYNCFPEDILFTSGATEANNLAIFSGLKLAKQQNPQKSVVLTSFLEHKSVLEPLIRNAEQLGLSLIFVNINENGQIDIDDFKQKLVENQVLWVSLCMTNGEIGVNQPIAKISKICHENNIILHVDASQAGYCNIDFDGLSIDYLTISAHKIYGPTGIGLLISRHLHNPLFEAMIYGGGQQNNLRSGTLPLPLIAGLAKSVEILDEIKVGEMAKLQELRDYLLLQLQSHFDISVHGDLKDRHPGNLHIAIHGIDSMLLLNNLMPYVAFSLGSACNGLNREHSNLMKSLNINQKEYESSFRITVGRMTTIKEIDFVIQKFCDSIKSCGK